MLCYCKYLTAVILVCVLRSDIVIIVLWNINVSYCNINPELTSIITLLYNPTDFSCCFNTVLEERRHLKLSILPSHTHVSAPPPHSVTPPPRPLPRHIHIRPLSQDVRTRSVNHCLIT